MPMTRRRRDALAFWLGAAAFALAALASTIYWARLDLTASRRHTLSPAAKDLRKELPETVRIGYYVSKALADRHPGPAAIEDLLREFEAMSRGAIRVRIVDPTKDPAEAEALGVTPQQMQIVERSEQRVALVYTGIVIEYLDRHATIPAVISTDTLEYELVRAIRSLVSDDKPVAGLLVGDGDKSVSNDYQTLRAGLASAGYEPREVQKGSAVDDDVDVLFVLGNAAMDRYDASFVDSFLMRGGRVFFAVKGVDIQASNDLRAVPVAAGGLLEALDAYGFHVARELVLDQSSLTVPFQNPSPSGGYRIQYVRYPHWVAIDPRYADRHSPMTASFAGLDLYWPSPLDIKPLDGIEYDELAKTSPKAWRQTTDFAAGPDDQARYAIERDQTAGQYLVAASASGSFPSAFSSADPAKRDGVPPAPPPPRPKSPATRMVVVSSADFLTDLMKMSDSGFNASFALAAADWLTSSDDLAALRTRAQSAPRLDRIKDASLRSSMIGLTYVVCLGLLPLGVAAYGVARHLRRERRERRFRAEIGGEA